MRTTFIISSTFKLILVLGFVLALIGCTAPAASPTPVATLLPVQDTPVTQEMATIRGTITYQGMPTPTSMLYFISPEQWYSMEVLTGNPSATFEMQVDPGIYQIIAFPVGSESQMGRPAAAYTTGSGISFLEVTAGQVVENIQVKNINSDRCVSVPFPASPDGRFPEIQETCNAVATQESLATIRGTITYQAPPTPTSLLYFISPEQWYSMEVSSASPAATFEFLVAPGTYQIIAFPVGSENQTFRPAAAYSISGSAIDFLTVAAGQVVEDIQVKNINSDRCVSVPFPASPDGLFPAIEATCN